MRTGYTASQVAGFLSGEHAVCRNGDGDIVGGPVLPACEPMDGASFSALASPRPSAPARVVPSETVAAGLPVIVFGISSDWTLTEQLLPLAEATGGTVADIDGADAVGDAIDAALEAAGAAPQPYFEWAPGDDASTLAFDAAGSVFEGETAAFSYDFGDGSDAATGAATAAHSYAAPGTYEVTLTVTDEKGRTAQAVASVTVVDDTAPEWGTLTVAPDRGDAQAGDTVTFTASGLAPGGRVSVAWDGTVGAAMGVVGDDGMVTIALAVPFGASAGALAFTMRALDELRSGGGAITINPTVAVCVAG
ncbi:PKD domain-containing protein [Microbacterium profundi]|uniref:PKD domain-containing protein n=1 Tax=Microbacterium profundi TaxID=450380 RepID=A0ABV3LL82_9MICO